MSSTFRLFDGYVIIYIFFTTHSNSWTIFDPDSSGSLIVYIGPNIQSQDYILYFWTFSKSQFSQMTMLSGTSVYHILGRVEGTTFDLWCLRQFISVRKNTNIQSYSLSSSQIARLLSTSFYHTSKQVEPSYQLNLTQILWGYRRFISVRTYSTLGIYSLLLDFQQFLVFCMLTCTYFTTH